jgi:hypothetical protein
VTGWLFGFIITGAIVSIGWFFFVDMFPRMIARRAARSPDVPMTVLPGADNQPIVAIDIEKSLEASKHTHDVFVSEASDLILQSRGAGLFAGDLLEQAAEKVDDAVKLRPGSFGANLLAGEIGVRRALLADEVEGVQLLEQAVVHFATASETKKGLIDAYVGRGWAHLERAYRLEDDVAGSAFLDAAAAFQEGFGVHPQNLFVLRGWGLAIDGAARLMGDDAALVRGVEDAYRLALAEHRGGDHELHEWYAGVRSAEEPLRIPMPALRDLN